MDIITRPQWGARTPKREVFLTTWSRRTGFVVHYSAGPPSQTVRAIQDFHMDVRDWADIGYNFLVTVDGQVWEGRQGTWLAIGAHSANNNTATIGVCMIGRDVDVTDAVKASVRWLYDEACRRAGRALATYGHGELNATSCPGPNLQFWVDAGMPAPTGEDSDMTPEESRQLFNSDRLLTALLLDTDDVTGLLESPGDPTPVTYPLRLAQRARRITEVETKVDQLLARPAVDAAAVAAALAADATFRQALIDGLAAHLQPATPAEVAEAVVDELHERTAA